MLSKKELFILQILDKITVGTNRHIQILSSGGTDSNNRKRLNHLKAEGYITAEWVGNKLAYTLTQAGLSEIEKTRRPYEIHGNIKSEHELLVTEAACWIYVKANRSIFDMVFDREINSIKSFDGIGHKPDIAFSKHQCIEVELSAKQTLGDGTKNGLEDNIVTDARNFNRVYYIVPDHKPGLMNRIKTLAQKNSVGNAVRVIPLSVVISDVAAYDNRNNSPKMEPVKGLPTPLHAEEEVVLSD